MTSPVDVISHGRTNVDALSHSCVHERLLGPMFLSGKENVFIRRGDFASAA
jgi:hypothetical protein